MQNRIFQGFVSILGANVGRTAISLLLTPILIRVLGSSEYGEYAFAIAIFTPLMTIVNMGIFQGVRKYVGERPQDEQWRNNIFAFYFRIAVGVSLIATVVIILIVSWERVLAVFGEEPELMFFVLALMVVPHQIYKLFRGMLMALGLEKISEPIHFLQQLLMKGLGIILAITGLGATGAFLGYGISLLVAGLLCLLYVVRHIGVAPLLKAPETEVSARELFGFNSLSVIHAFLVGSLLNADVILVRAFVGDASAGFYKAALVITGFLWFVPRSLNTVLLHSTASLWENENREHITTLASRSTRYTLITAVLLAIGLGTLASPFVSIYYGEDFTSTVQPLLLLLPGTIGFALVRPVMALIQAKGNLRLMVMATGAAALLNVLLNFLLIPIFGMSGAAVATSISYGSMLTFHVFGARSLGIDPLTDIRIGRVLGSAAVTAVIIVPLSLQIGSQILSLVLIPPIGLIVYASTLIFVGGVEVGEVRDIYDQYV